MMHNVQIHYIILINFIQTKSNLISLKANNNIHHDYSKLFNQNLINFEYSALLSM